MSASTRAVAVIWVLATLMLLVFPLLGTPEAFRLYYSNAMQILTSLSAAAVCFYSMSAFPAGSPLRKVWAAMGAGVLAWGIGATIFALYPVLTGGEETPYPFFSDIGYLATGPLMIVGLLIFKRSTGLESPLWGKLLAVVLLAVSGVLAYRANAEGLSDPSLAMRATSLAYLIFDPLLLAVTVLTATGFRGGEVGAAWWYAVAGILLYFLANQAYTFLVLSETYATGHPIDMGWMLGFGMIAWAALKTRRLVT
jgi:hypothetical protein